ncbi:mismatch repair protein MLH3 Ecym_2384 [Eremothecium cymbalariae DBVPG|uniref:MutL C-terminal dimerisation domain-containing protein n=1 Tax=Eremothecium cymbalariae (strain CBS 270.75 / DBVPG 7215 / KCTC 17166 / NRRL Y-17582) TaxID=931890 RepID=G8JNP9_ERECY|nr:Hypothetical protein Ecym_2384 [Eremothecium cymbalariae DBVPG\
MGKLEKLQDDVLQLLQSQISIVSIGSAVRELVQNSVDSGCANVEVYVDVGRWKVVVKDDGHGISPEDLNMVGQKNFTSKLRNLESLEGIRTFGFRGEGIFTLSNISKVTVVSRYHEYNSIWMRALPSRAVMVGPKDAEKLMYAVKNSTGTTVVLTDLFYNLPVRRKMITKEPMYKVYDEIKRYILQVLICLPVLNVSVVFIDGSQRKTIICSKNISKTVQLSKSLTSIFQNTFGAICGPENFKYVSARYQDFIVDGIISVIPVPTRDYQFIYINKQSYEDKSFYVMLNKIFRSANFGTSDAYISDVKSVGQPYSSYPVFLIKCACPNSVSDLMQHPAKVVTDSEHTSVVQPLILHVVKSFLKLQGYCVDTSGPGKATKSEAFSSMLLNNSSSQQYLVATPTTNIVLGTNTKSAKLSEREFIGRIIMGRKRQKTKVEVPVVEKVNECIEYSIIKKIKEKVFTASAKKTQSYSDIPKVEIEDESISDYLKKNDASCFKIKKSQLKDCIVINQVDKKFILLKLQPSKFNKNPLLLILDQHAADERIKLETYIRDYLINILGPFPLDQNVNCSIKIPVTSTEAELFKSYKDEFSFWGFNFTIEETTGESIMLITFVPRLVDARAKNCATYLKKVLLQHGYDLKSHKKIRASSLKSTVLPNEMLDNLQWWKYINAMPRLLIEIFNSKACRSAVMFGDTLTHEECVLLINELSKCNIPFQCAHGRPSIVPIVEMQAEENPYFGLSNKDYLVD